MVHDMQQRVTVCLNAAESAVKYHRLLYNLRLSVAELLHVQTTTCLLIVSVVQYHTFCTFNMYRYTFPAVYVQKAWPPLTALLYIITLTKYLLSKNSNDVRKGQPHMLLS